MINLILLLLLFAVLSVTYRGWVLTMLWSWFLVPLGVPAISTATALGIVLIVAILTTHATNKTDKTESKDPWELAAVASGVAFGVPSLMLVLGYIISLFV
jgi:hypothetical protein